MNHNGLLDFNIPLDSSRPIDRVWIQVNTAFAIAIRLTSWSFSETLTSHSKYCHVELERK